MLINSKQIKNANHLFTIIRSNSQVYGVGVTDESETPAVYQREIVLHSSLKIGSNQDLSS